MSSAPLRHLRLLSLGDRRYDLRRELDAAALNSDDDEIVRAVVQLDDLVGHSPQVRVECAGVENDRLFGRRSHGAQYGRFDPTAVAMPVVVRARVLPRGLMRASMRSAQRNQACRTDGVGFEPTVRFHVHTLSRRAP